MQDTSKALLSLINALDNSTEAALETIFSTAYALNKEMGRHVNFSSSRITSTCILISNLVDNWRINFPYTADAKPIKKTILLKTLKCLEANKYICFVNDKTDLANKGISFVIPRPLSPWRICLKLFKPYRRVAEIQYRLMKRLCELNDVCYSIDTIHYFTQFAKTLNLIRRSKNSEALHKFAKLTESNMRRLVISRKELEKKLEENSDVSANPIKRNILALFLDCCEIIGSLGTDWYKPDSIVMKGWCDPEYMLGKIFGLPTSIPDFDALFGGGLLLPTSTKDSKWLGKTIIIGGNCGSGKTILASQLAFEVARKGGIVFIFALEQEHEDLLRQYRSFGWISEKDNVVVAESIVDFLKKAKNFRHGTGLIGIGKVSKCDIKSHYNAIMQLIEDSCFNMYPLKAIVVDPLNSILIDPEIDPYLLRDETNRFFQSLKKKDVCGIFTVENEADPIRQFYHEKNIADIVIELSSEENKKDKYTQRIIEIIKSRGQPTHRGKHAYIIKKGEGFALYTSSAAILVERHGRQPYSIGNDRVTTGLHTLDSMLINDTHCVNELPQKMIKIPNGGYQENSITMLQGPKGCGRTELGLLFLLCPKQGIKKNKKMGATKSLYVTFKHSPSSVYNLIKKGPVAPALKNYYLANWNEIGMQKVLDRLVVLQLPKGYMRAGDFFQRLISVFDEAKETGTRIEKVVIDDIPSIEDGCPLISSEPSFIATLIRTLRTENCTSLVLSSGDNEPGHNNSVLHDGLSDSCDCIVELKRVHFRGKSCIAIHLKKTSGMEHDQTAYGISFDGNKGIDITRQFSLVANIMSGEIKEIPVKLFFHCETEAEAVYNKRIETALRSTLASNVKLELDCNIRPGLYLSDMGLSAPTEELQIVQLDEHQVLYARDHWLEWYKNYKAPSVRSEFEYSKNIFSNNDDFWAIPYYGNISFLAYDSKKISLSEDLTWDYIADKCREHPEELIFDFPKVSHENYNCLFFEILFDLLQSGTDMCSIAEALMSKENCLRILFSDKLLINEAIIKFWTIGHAALRFSPIVSRPLKMKDSEKQPKVFTVSEKACIWRHWYGTYNQMLSDIKRNNYERYDDIKICALPGGFTTAGNWYLGVTRSSFGKDTGLSVIKKLSQFALAQERLENGVGFPLYSTFLNSEKGNPPSALWRCGKHTLADLYSNAFRRSEFGCYFQIADSLGYYLKNILSLSDISLLEKQAETTTSILERLISQFCNENKIAQCHGQKNKVCNRLKDNGKKH